MSPYFYKASKVGNFKNFSLSFPKLMFEDSSSETALTSHANGLPDRLYHKFDMILCLTDQDR